MTFLLDENFPKSVRAILEDAGHRVLDFREIGFAGAPDEGVMSVALGNGAVILTTDRDFFHTLGRRFPDHYGIVVVALKKPTRDSIIGRIVWFLETIALDDLKGRSFQLRDKAWMVYPPL